MIERQITYAQALNEALFQEMERDPSVIVYGLDVTDHKGIFGSTKGLQHRFGDRVFSTPLSEDAMTGVGLGAAIAGHRPVHIHIRSDFLLLGMNQLANMISSYEYLTAGSIKVPLVIRAVIGRGWGQGAQHSKSMQSIFSHLPGLTVIMPASPYDAKGMLTAAIREDSPVICLEHRWLYDVEGPVPAESYVEALGEPRVVAEGQDATVLTTSWFTVEALMAADLMKKRGISLEVIDIRTITPLNLEPITASARKTGHVVIADYDWTFCGFSAEVAAQVGESCFGYLKKPIRRIGFAHVPCPTTRPLENVYYPNAGTIVREVEALLAAPPMPLDQVEFYTWTRRFRGPF